MEKKGVYFAVWAPNAQAVSVIGEFNEWDAEKNPMKKVGPIGVTHFAGSECRSKGSIPCKRGCNQVYGIFDPLLLRGW